MNIIAGCLIVRDNKILMVQEAQERCYGQWNYPAGHVDAFENITDAAIREVYEETGCKVKLTGVLPILHKISENNDLIHVRFTAEVIEENRQFDKNEILDVEWLDIEKIKNMTNQELRAQDINLQFLKDLESQNIQ